MPNGFFYLHSLDRSISVRRDVWLVFIFPCLIVSPVFNANSEDPDQMLCSATSDLGLHRLPMSLLWDTMLKWVDVYIHCREQSVC